MIELVHRFNSRCYLIRSILRCLLLEVPQAEGQQSQTVSRTGKLRPYEVGGEMILEACDQLTTLSFQYAIHLAEWGNLGRSYRRETGLQVAACSVFAVV